MSGYSEVRRVLRDAIEDAEEYRGFLPDSIARLKAEGGDPVKITEREMWLARRTECIIQCREMLADLDAKEGDTGK